MHELSFLQAAPGHRAGWRRAPGWRAALVRLLALSTVALVLAECGLRLAVANAHLSPPVFRATGAPLAYTLSPSVATSVWHVGRLVSVSTDTQGHRLTPGAVGIEEAPTLHLIGDSQVFGWGLSDHETLTARLQQRWGGPIRVVNHGVPGYGPDDYLEILQSVPATDEAVIVFTEENDAGDTYRRGGAAHVACGHIASFARDGPLQCALLRSRLVQGLVVGLNHLRHRYLMTPLGLSEHSRVAGRVVHARIAQQLEEAVRQRPGTVLVTVAPWKGRYAADWQRRYAPPPMAPAQLRDTPSPWPDALDTLAVFARHPDPQSLYLPGDTHLSPEGTRLLADHIVRHAHTRRRTATQETR